MGYIFFVDYILVQDRIVRVSVYYDKDNGFLKMFEVLILVCKI